jgi:hypothetical protein
VLRRNADGQLSRQVLGAMEQWLRQRQLHAPADELMLLRRDLAPAPTAPMAAPVTLPSRQNSRPRRLAMRAIVEPLAL